MLALFCFYFCGSSHLDYGNSSCELGQPLLKLFAIVIGVGRFNFLADLGDSGLNVFLLAASAHNGGLVLGNCHLFCSSKYAHVDGVQLQSEVGRNDLSAGEDCHILQHCLAPVAKAGGLYCTGGESATDLVEDEGGQSLSVNVFGDDEQRLSGLHHKVGDVDDVLLAGDLVAGEEDVGVIEHGGLIVRVGHKVGSDIPLVKTHSLGELEIDSEFVVVLYGYNAVLAYLVEGLCDYLAHFGVACRNRSGSCDLLFGLNGLGVGQKLFYDGLSGLFDALPESYGVGACNDVL